MKRVQAVVDRRKPEWLKVKLPGGITFSRVKNLVAGGGLHTVCESAHCPNIGECWSRQTATFMLMGDTCTRNCRFCAVPGGPVAPLDADEPRRVAQAVQELGLHYAVITSVTRDDLADGGASHFARTIQEIRRARPSCQVEVLIPDFQGRRDALQTVIDAGPDVLNHNVETVPRLYALARPQADYQRSLHLLKEAHAQGAKTKSGLMVGLGEDSEEVLQVMHDLYRNGCRMLTIGQYLQPSKRHLPVARYVPPKEFDELKRSGLRLGFAHIEAGPLVRSSYHAEQQWAALAKRAPRQSEPVLSRGQPALARDERTIIGR
ncbi:lipoyl synthase [candidate division KSB1 bacterium]|nr:lipoyl synthase [candidate division KSB1 bacterium]